MTHEEFMRLYDNSLQHGWVTSKDSATAARQKQREREYNREYYQKHKSMWDTVNDVSEKLTGRPLLTGGNRTLTTSHSKTTYDRNGNVISDERGNFDEELLRDLGNAQTSGIKPKKLKDYPGYPGNDFVGPRDSGKRKVNQLLNSVKNKLKESVSNIMNSPTVQKAKNKVKKALTISGGEETLTTSSSKTTYDRHGNVIKEEHGDYSRELLTDLGKARYGRRR